LRQCLPRAVSQALWVGPTRRRELSGFAGRRAARRSK
jgi:hypothetical protein